MGYRRGHRGLPDASPKEGNASVAMPIILGAGAAAGCCSEQEVEMATIKSPKGPEEERIRIETEESPSDATLARTQPVENSPAAHGRKAQSARPSPAVASPLNSEPPHADLIGQYYMG